MYQSIATTTNIEALETQLIIVNKISENRTKLVALWRLDAHSKLYCKWVEKDNNN